MTFLNQVALIIKSCFHHGISSVGAKGRKLERQTVLLRFCQERIQTTEGLCKIVLLLILGVISVLMVEQVISIFFLFTIVIYLVLSEGEFKNRLYQRNAVTKLKICSVRLVLFSWRKISMINTLFFFLPLPSDQKVKIISAVIEKIVQLCWVWYSYFPPVSVKNTHEKSSQSTPPCLFGELSSSVNSAGMICHILNR